MISKPSTSDRGEDAPEVVSPACAIQKELSSGIVSLALLALLAHADNPLYGYQIARSSRLRRGDCRSNRGPSIQCCGRSRPGGCLRARWSLR